MHQGLLYSTLSTKVRQLAGKYCAYDGVGKTRLDLLCEEWDVADEVQRRFGDAKGDVSVQGPGGRAGASKEIVDRCL